MTETNYSCNIAPCELANQLEELQRHLLLVKAAGLAYQNCFEDCPLMVGTTTQPQHAIAEYFVYQFLELKPEEKLEAAMHTLWGLAKELERLKGQQSTCKPQPKAEKTSSHTIKISISEDEA